MAVLLNGWRRTALALSILWICVALTTAGLSYCGKTDGYFVYQSLPTGTTVTSKSIKLPNGPIISREAEQGSTSQNGKRVPESDLPDDLQKPWNVDWGKQPGVPTESEVRWVRLLVLGLATPLLLWMAAELLAAVVRWIARGFRQPEPPSRK